MSGNQKHALGETAGGTERLTPAKSGPWTCRNSFRKGVIHLMFDASGSKWSSARQPMQGERECYATYSASLVVTRHVRRLIIS